MTKLKFLIAGLLLVATACTKKNQSIPSGILEEEKMVGVLTDMRLAEANAKIARQMQQYEEHMLDSIYFVIFKIHDVTSDQVEHSLDYYGEDPERMKVINEKVLEELNRIN